MQATATLARESGFYATSQHRQMVVIGEFANRRACEKDRCGHAKERSGWTATIRLAFVESFFLNEASRSAG